MDKTYKPRRWAGETIIVNCHWWSRGSSKWFWLIHDRDELDYGDIFLRPDATQPTEPPGGELEGCDTVDWVGGTGVVADGAGTSTTTTATERRLDTLEQEMVELKQRVAELSMPLITLTSDPKYPTP